LVKKVDTDLVKRVLDTVVAEHEEWAPVPITEASPSWWELRRQGVEIQRMTREECENEPGCKVQSDTCETPVDALTNFTIVDLRPMEETGEYSSEDPKYGPLHGAEPVLDNDAATITYRFIAVHDKLCKDVVGTAGLRECEVWEMVAQYKLPVAAHNVCTVTVATEADPVSGENLEEAEQKLEECQSSLDQEGHGGECSFQAEVSFKAGALECLAETDDFGTFEAWLQQDAEYKMYVDRGGVPRRVRAPDDVECK